MPFTPFHLGPGALFKALGGRKFSFMIFGGSQILMDVEPLVRIIRRDLVLHGMSHTVVGAFVVAAVAAGVGRPIGNLLLPQLGIRDHAIGWAVAIVSALIGTYSHIALDAIMHRDMSPLWPVAHGNTLLSARPVGTLHLLCAVSGLAGAAFIALRAWRDARTA